jgi:hypothetical protein
LKAWIKKTINNFLYRKGSNYGLYWNTKEGENTDPSIRENYTGTQGKSDVNGRAHQAKGRIVRHSARPNE